MNDVKYVSPEECAKRLNYSLRYFRGVVIKRDLVEGVHYVRTFGGRKILLIWDLVERELLKGVRLPIEQQALPRGIPMAGGGYCYV